MPSHPQTRVLYVDDHDDSREMLTTLLAISQIDVTAVATAKTAVSLMQSERFDLCLLESWFPDTDGFELCRMIREVHPKTPVVFFSGAAMTLTRNEELKQAPVPTCASPTWMVYWEVSASLFLREQVLPPSPTLCLKKLLS